MARYRSYRDLDWPLLAVTLIICALGVLQIYSATRDTHWQDAWWKQLIWIGIALVLMWVVTSIDYHTLLSQIPLLYSISVGSLIGVLVLGRLVFGSRRWIKSSGGQSSGLGIRQIGDNISGSKVRVGAAEATRLNLVTY